MWHLLALADLLERGFLTAGEKWLTTDNCTCEYVLMNQEPFDYASDGPVEAEGCGPTVPRFYIKQITEF